MEFSIIIPTIDEARLVGPRVAACLDLRPMPEVVVADGGSSDDTCAQATGAGARVVVAPRRGRGPQMNAGATEARGDVLVFLHADVALPQAAWSALVEALGDQGVTGGAFSRRFDSPSRLLNLGSRLADIRGRWLRVYLGDQAIFARREAFVKAGGFPDALLFEDVEFSRRLRRQGRTVLIREPVLASSRRFDEEGNARRLCRNMHLILLYQLGADPNRLARRYYPGQFGTTGRPRGAPAASSRNTCGVARGSPPGGGR